MCFTTNKTLDVLHNEEVRLAFCDEPEKMIEKSTAWIFRISPADIAETLAGWPPEKAVNVATS